jgi:hypothetical protein
LVLLISYCFQGIISGFFAHVASTVCPQGDQTYYPFLSTLASTGRPLNELVATVVGLAVGFSVIYAQGKHVHPPLKAGDRIWASFENAHLDVRCSPFYYDRIP